MTLQIQTWEISVASTHPGSLTLNLQMLLPVDDFWQTKEFLAFLRVLGVDLVSIGVVIKVICHLLFGLGKVESTKMLVFSDFPIRFQCSIIL